MMSLGCVRITDRVQTIDRAASDGGGREMVVDRIRYFLCFSFLCTVSKFKPQIFQFPS